MRISDWSSDVCASDLPSNGIGFFSGLKRSSLFMISSMRSAIACRVALSGHSIQLNTIDSSSLDATAPKKSLIFPLGTSSSQHSTTRVAPCRSEEHTSELQSLMRTSYAVFCLKKKKSTYNKIKNK